MRLANSMDCIDYHMIMIIPTKYHKLTKREKKLQTHLDSPGIRTPSQEFFRRDNTHMVCTCMLELLVLGTIIFSSDY